jgi:SAM-dependent methyltransferase
MICLVCDTTEAAYLYTQNGCRVFRCASCGFTFVAPTPTAEELAGYYSRSYAVPLERYAGSVARNEGRIADLERWQPQRGRLLEVGASYGHSLALARARGWEVAGVELSPTAASYARAQFDLDVHHSDVLDAPLAAGSFDAAMMWHVLEHTRDPRAQLMHLRALLRPGGVLGLRVPNIASFGARLAGRSWPWMCPPAHLWFFSPATLPRLLARCGFEMIEVATLRGDGNNLYQHALIALGGKLNTLRRSLASTQRTARQGQQTGDRRQGLLDPQPTAHNPPALQHAWVGLLARAQPVTEALARATRPLVERLERAGWGDELLVYARRPIKT